MMMKTMMTMLLVAQLGEAPLELLLIRIGQDNPQQETNRQTMLFCSWFFGENWQIRKELFTELKIILSQAISINKEKPCNQCKKVIMPERILVRRNLCFHHYNVE